MTGDYTPGSFVRSTAGHDRDQIFLILEETGDRVLIADGKTRTADHPKEKKKKHLELLDESDDRIAAAVRQGKPLHNEMIKYALKGYRRKQNVKE